MTKDSENALDSKIEEILSPYEIILKEQPTLVKELEELKKLKIVQNPEIRKIIEQSLHDKAVLRQDAFTTKSTKDIGLSLGYKAIDIDGSDVLLKQFYKTPDDDTSNRNIDRRFGINELIGSSMYQLLLYDRAPKEGLVIPDEEHKDLLYVRSKFFKDAVQLSEFSGLINRTFINPSNPRLQQLGGFEKVIAACHMLGEIDYHAANIMVTPDSAAVKIDHGRSFIGFNKDFDDMVSSTFNIFSKSRIDYISAIDEGNLSFDPKKYSNALKQMVSQLSDHQIEDVVDQKIYELKKAGFDPKGIDVSLEIDHRTIVDNFDDLAKFYKEKVKESRQNMQQIAEDVDIISRFNFKSPEREKQFKQGGWLRDCAYNTPGGPIKIAIRLGVTINDTDPIIYAISKDILIDGMDPLDWISDISRTESSRTELSKTESSRTEFSRTEFSRTESVKLEPPLPKRSFLRSQERRER